MNIEGDTKLYAEYYAVEEKDSSYSMNGNFVTDYFSGKELIKTCKENTDENTAYAIGNFPFVDAFVGNRDILARGNFIDRETVPNKKIYKTELLGHGPSHISEKDLKRHNNRVKWAMDDIFGNIAAKEYIKNLLAVCVIGNGNSYIAKEKPITSIYTRKWNGKNHHPSYESSMVKVNRLDTDFSPRRIA